MSMTRKLFARLVLVCFFTIVLLKSTAQNKSWNLGFIAGLSNYQGDLIKEDFSLKAMHPSFGFEANYEINKVFSMRSMLFYGRFSGSDYFYDDRKGRGFSSETTFLELAFNAQINPLPIIFKKEFALMPKIFIGGGLMTYDVVTWNIPSNYYPHSMNHKLINGSFHFGANVFYKINDKYSVGYEMSHRSLLNDKIDGVSAGNPKSYDWYYLSNFIFTFKI